MKLLIIDPGTYSVKFLEVKQEKRGLYLTGIHEVVLSEYLQELDEDVEDDLTHVKIRIISQVVRSETLVGKVLMILPTSYITTRYLSLPVGNRKKAEMMIPFQLDENLPFKVNQTHYASKIKKESKNKSKIITSITQKDAFEVLYSGLKREEALPAAMVAEPMIPDGFMDLLKNPPKGPLLPRDFVKSCMFLNIGHSKSEAFFFYEGELVSNHVSYFGGSDVDVAIADGYQIDLDEAIEFKHENSFFLTHGQYDNVDNDQKIFAKIMENCFEGFISELQRWDLGYRVRYGKHVDKIYLYGGTANIKNIENFIAYHTQVQTEKLNISTLFDQKQLKFRKGESSRFMNVSLLAASQYAREPIPNLLTGEYLSDVSQAVSLHSSTFLFARVALVCFALMIGILVENAFLGKEIRRADANLIALMGSSSVDLSPKDKKIYKSRPERITGKIKKEMKQIESEIKSIKSIQDIDALRPLASLSGSLPVDKDISLATFSSEAGFITADFVATTREKTKEFQTRIEAIGFKNLKTAFANNFTKLTVEFEE